MVRGILATDHLIPGWQAAMCTAKYLQMCTVRHWGYQSATNRFRLDQDLAMTSLAEVKRSSER